MSSETIHPNDLTTAHVNRSAAVTYRDGTEVRGPIGPYQHEILWVSERRLCDMRPAHLPGQTRTEFTIGHVDLVALTGDDVAVRLLDDTEAGA